MKRKSKNVHKQSLRLAFVFFLSVLFLLICSLAFRLIAIVQKSEFDSTHRFTIAVSKALQNESFSLISFAPETKSISILSVPKNNKQNYLWEWGKRFEVPIDGYVSFSKLDNDQNHPSRALLNMLLNYNKLQTNLTIIDLVRLWFFARTVPNQTIVSKQLELLENNENGTDKIIFSLFLDQTISLENQEIAIVNGALVLGLGNKLSRLIQNLGGHVVSVSTADKEVEVSEVSYYGKKTYTVKRLAQILGFKLTNKGKNRDENAISDVIITIGRDRLSSLPF